MEVIIGQVKIGDRVYRDWENMEIGHPVEMVSNQNPAAKGNVWARRNGIDKMFSGKFQGKSEDGKNIYLVFRIK